MSESDKTLRERLLNMETTQPMTNETYRKQVQALLDTRLSVAKRAGFALLALVGLWTAGAFTKPAFTPTHDMKDDVFYRLPMIFSFLISVVWMVLTGWAALRGVVRRTHRPWIAATTLAMGFVYIVALMFIFVTPISQEESRTALGTQFALIGFFLLNTIGLCAILSVLYRGQFRSQEKLLEIEYRLADLAERFDKQRSR